MSLQNRLNKLEAAHSVGGECQCIINITTRVIYPILEGNTPAPVADAEPLSATCDVCGARCLREVVVVSRREEVEI
jgi:hypothetical protein